MGANKLKIKALCMEKMFKKIYNMAAIEVPEKIVKEGQEDAKPTITEFKTQHEKKTILKQGLSKCRYEAVMREFKEEVLRDLQQ